MKLIRTKVEYYDNKFATPMLICLPSGTFMLALGFGINSGACAIIGLILLALFVILKIANSVAASSEQTKALDEICCKLKFIYDGLVKQGFPPSTARLSIAKDLQERYEKGEINVDVYNTLSNYVMKMM